MSILRNSYGRVADSRKFPLQRSLSLDGTLAGSINAAVNGSVTPVRFYYQAEANRLVTLNKISITVSDAGNTTITNYGSIAGPLTNGITFYTIINGFEIPLTPIIKKTADYFSVGAQSTLLSLSGSSRVANYSFSLFDYSEGIILDGDNEDRFGMIINDNLSALTLHVGAVDGNFRFKAM